MQGSASYTEQQPIAHNLAVRSMAENTDSILHFELMEQVRSK